MSDQDTLYFHGMDITTGQYLTPPMQMEAFAAVVQNQVQNAQAGQKAAPLAPAGIIGALPVVPAPTAGPSFDPTKLEEAGWGVIFAQNADPAIYDALRPLLDLRKSQASRIRPQRYQEFVGPNGWQSTDTADTFLQRQGATPGPVDPDQMPYYLLIVADPLTVTYTCQLNLDIHRGVGRIYFETPQEYASYARTVAAAESGGTPLPRRAVVFASAIDQTTQMSCNELAIPLAKMLKADRPVWQVDSLTADDATKARLIQLLSGGDPPALLFTVTHGGCAPCADPLQLQRQGCLICQGLDVTKIGTPSYNPADFYVCGEDIPDEAQLPPMVTFHFACFGAGTPEYDQFVPSDGPPPAVGSPPSNHQLAPQPFVAYLPQRVLGLTNGGVLATIGHVERAWGFTFHAERKDDIATFENTLISIMDGDPVGHAMQVFARRYSELSTQLAGEEPTQGNNLPPVDQDDAAIPSMAEVAAVANAAEQSESADQAAQPSDSANYIALWTASKDARNYVIVGDPAVRLPLGVSGEACVSETAPTT
ncbi:MAG: hypothetical protein ACLPPV_15705 [Candidatus Korobacteraceae bacterium]|jgi:hypothetical protein